MVYSSAYLRVKRGFTLIELLVVIAILAILAAMLAPVFAEARKSIYAYACQSNMRQMGVAATMYAQDYDERYATPTEQSGMWIPDLHTPYLNKWRIWICPSDTRAQLWDGVWGSPSFYGRTSYVWNAYVFQGDPSDWHYSIGLAAIQYPSLLPLWTEGYANGGWVTEGAPMSDPMPTYAMLHNAYGDNMNSDPKDPTTIGCFKRRTAPHLDVAHHGGGNYTFADGHTRWLVPRRFITNDIIANHGVPVHDPTDPMLTNGARYDASLTVCPVFCCPTMYGEPPGDGENPWFRP
ncbi:MAG TPA: type II secretion system protein [Chthonomonadaceae bacterium]|nr:type II secretion system protein [Chthonomonadaceae bacterium]